MIIAVDFDGTIVEDAYPEIGKPKQFAFAALKELQKTNQLILWTCREGRFLQDAVEFCKQNGVVFYAVNKNYPEEVCQDNGNFMRKIDADVFIDDRNIGGFPGWSAVYQQLSGDAQIVDTPKKRKWFWQK